MTPLILARAAQPDLRRAARFYEEENLGLGTDFLNEVERAFRRLRRTRTLALRCAVELVSSWCDASPPDHLPN